MTTHSSRVYGVLKNGTPVTEHTLRAPSGALLRAITYGGIVTAIHVPDREGRLADVVLGFDNLAAYETRHPYFGAITGRVAGRIPNGAFEAGGRVRQLELNDGQNHLHGGWCGLDRRVWEADVVPMDSGDALRLQYTSPAGEEGYPGEVRIEVVYEFTHAHEFVIRTRATTSEPTPVSLTNHSYFHLGGDGHGTVLDHRVSIFADQAFPASADMTPSLDPEPVGGRCYDFRRPTLLADALPHLHRNHGDFYFFGKDRPAVPRRAALVEHGASGRRLEVFSSDTGLQFYTSSMMDCPLPGKSGRVYELYSGLCLECHGHPGASGIPAIGDILLHPGEVQTRETRYVFSAA